LARSSRAAPDAAAHASAWHCRFRFRACSTRRAGNAPGEAAELHLHGHVYEAPASPDS
jgi:hypothetical protein